MTSTDDEILAILKSIKTSMKEGFDTTNKQIVELNDQSEARFDALNRRLYNVETRLSAIELCLGLDKDTKLSRSGHGHN
jgi:hypothetical protein